MNSRCFWKNTYEKVLSFPLCQGTGSAPGIYLQQSWLRAQHMHSAYWIQNPRPGTPPLTLAAVGCGYYPPPGRGGGGRSRPLLVRLRVAVTRSRLLPSSLSYAFSTSLCSFLPCPAWLPPHPTPQLFSPSPGLSSPPILLSLAPRSSTQRLSSGQCSQQHCRPAVRIF